MKGKFQFYKNIILVVASALTLVAVTFAWFSTSFTTNLDSFEAVVSGNAVKVDYYQEDENGQYQPLSGDIELEDFVPGNYNKYKIVVTTKTSDKLQLSFAIDGLPSDIPQELKDSVCIKYTMYTTNKGVGENGSDSYADAVAISWSNDFVPLSTLDNGTFFNNLLLSNYQQSASDVFVIYYEIGLSENAPATIGGMESDLGSIKISAQRVG